MRIKLREGKQSELVELAKKDMSWSDYASVLGLSEGYLRTELRREKRLLSEEIYEKLCSICFRRFDKFIMGRLEDNWGRVKGGSLSSGRIKSITIPEESVELAEFFGVMLGDGNLTKIESYKVGSYQVRVVGDSRYDNVFLVGHVKSLVQSLFGVGARCYDVKGSNTLVLNVNSKRLVEFLESKGFKPGDKIRNKLGIPGWIKENKAFLSACLRGLYDTDGGIYKLNNQNTFQIAFTSHNCALLKDVKDSLLALGMSPSRIVDGRRIYITKKSELRKFLKQIGFRNSKHLNKVKVWNL
jgi:intein/homing endonuclease